ncbi:MAG: 4-alpha-glucanotransferase, partial [Oscillospiraceae bacterium]|nr:4-alpha-glucanotransferase [Oscillospiraceae bacterium]
MRDCGILLHISSLPGRGGCGTMGKEARRFVDYLRAAGQSCWQVLPLTPPAKGDSPYSSYSVFAGNPFLIDLGALRNENLLPEDALKFLPDGAETADYGWCESVHMKLLRESYLYAGDKLRPAVARFSARNAFWLPDYALFMAIKSAYGRADLRNWPDALRLRESDAMEAAQEAYAREIRFWEYVQYLFFMQWRALRRYANARGITLIGDMPIYVAADSADVWANPKVFDLDADLLPRRVSGVPPDAFSADG